MKDEMEKFRLTLIEAHHRSRNPDDETIRAFLNDELDSVTHDLLALRIQEDDELLARINRLIEEKPTSPSEQQAIDLVRAINDGKESMIAYLRTADLTPERRAKALAHYRKRHGFFSLRAFEALEGVGEVSEAVKDDLRKAGEAVLRWSMPPQQAAGAFQSAPAESDEPIALDSGFSAKPSVYFSGHAEAEVTIVSCEMMDRTHVGILVEALKPVTLTIESESTGLRQQVPIEENGGLLEAIFEVTPGESYVATFEGFE